MQCKCNASAVNSCTLGVQELEVQCKCSELCQIVPRRVLVLEVQCECRRTVQVSTWRVLVP